MLTIRSGMTRADLIKVFTTEGGLSTPFQQTFVGRDCSYFKVNVIDDSELKIHKRNCLFRGAEQLDREQRHNHRNSSRPRGRYRESRK